MYVTPVRSAQYQRMDAAPAASASPGWSAMRLLRGGFFDATRDDLLPAIAMLE